MITGSRPEEWWSVDNIDLGERADVTGLLERVVLPVVDVLVHDDESVDGIALMWEGDPLSRGRSDLLLTVTIEDELFRWVAVTQDAPPEAETSARSRLASDLQDFVAESRFGRGQLRDHPF